jgi:hypothetical protein
MDHHQHWTHDIHLASSLKKSFRDIGIQRLNKRLPRLRTGFRGEIGALVP